MTCFNGYDMAWQLRLWVLDSCNRTGREIETVVTPWVHKMGSVWEMAQAQLFTEYSVR